MRDYLKQELAEALLTQALKADESSDYDDSDDALTPVPQHPRPHNNMGAAADVKFFNESTDESGRKVSE